jgi:cell division protein FtsI (penicillin-binding protein 3)
MAYNQTQHHIVKLPAWRRRVLLLMILAGFVGLFVRNVYLQSLHKDFLQQKGDARYSRNIVLQAHRGKITDRNGELLAISSPVESVWASPPDVVISKQQTEKMASLLGMKVKDVSKKLVNIDREFVYIKRRISPDLAAQVMSLNIPGIFLQREYKRFYPAGDVTAHLVGFTGIDDAGQEGFELAQNTALSGKPGSRKVIKDRRGRIVEDLEAVKVPQEGHDLVLSIDRRLQYLAFRELSRAVETHKAKAAAAVILDAKTGEVLAMVNLPTYNPNKPVNIKGKTRNRAVTDTFEPGSTMKPVAAAAAMQFGDYKPNTPIQTAPGSMSIGPATIHDSHAHGILTVAEVIQKSSNVGAAKMALSLKREELWSAFNQLGFGTQTHVLMSENPQDTNKFPGEASGILRPFKSWRPIEQATMSYGHGISVTLLQLARAYTVFANDGELKPVSLIKLNEPTVGRQVFSAEVANDVKSMLELVVLPGGTALRAQVAGYRVGGKTGTAHKLGAHGYEENKYVASFVGMAPTSNPRLIMAVMVDEPDPANDQYYGGVVAAPVFSKVMADALRMLAVPQDAANNNVVIPPAGSADDIDVKESI